MPKTNSSSRHDRSANSHFHEFKHIYPVAPVQLYEDDNPIAKHTHHRHEDTQENMRNEACGQLCNRLLLCMFAVCLLWATSLQVCVAIVGFNISIPSFSVVVANCNYAYSEVKGQRDGYADCARRQMKQCGATLDTAYAEQRLQLATVQQLNQRYANQYQSTVGNCTSAVTNMKNAVTAWSAQGIEYTIPYQQNCTNTQRSATATTLGDTTRSRASVYTASHAYTVESDSTIVRLADYTSALSAYNAQYLHNKTRSLQRLAQTIVTDISTPHIANVGVSFVPVGNVLDQLLACTSLANHTTLQCNYNIQETLLQNFAYQQSIMLRTVRDMRAALIKATTSFNTLLGYVATAVTAANSFYDSVAGPAGVIQWIRNNVGNVGNLCGKSTPNYCSFTKASWMVPTPQFPSIPYVSYPVEAKVIWDTVSAIEISERNKVTAMAAALNRELQQWMQDVHTAIDVHADFMPHDYHPPQYPAGRNASEEVEIQAQRSSAFISNVEDILSARNNTQVNSDAVVRLVNATNYLNLADSLLSEFATSFATFSGTSIDFTLLIQSVLAVQTLLFLFDYIYRTFQTVRIVSKFWRRGSVQLPMVDLRNTYDIADAWFVCIARVFDMLPFVSLQLLWLAMLVILIIWGFAAVFVPEYTSYVSTCVEHSQNNTFVSRNLYAVAYNYASSEGSGVISRGLGEYNIQSGVYCTGSAASSLQVYTTLLNQLYAHNQTLTDNRKDLLTLSACIDVPQLDSAFVRACCNENNYRMEYSDLPHCAASVLQCPRIESIAAATISSPAYLPPGTYGASPACSAENLLREDRAGDAVTAANGVVIELSAFNCKALPKCEITCSKPDTQTITVWTKHCSCMAEWYLNGAIVQTLVALLAYLLINISRVLLARGTVQLLWRHLTPEIFDYTANCDGSGKLMNAALLQSHAYDEETTADRDETHNNEFQSALQMKVRQSIVLYERKARILVIVALLINTPWIVLVAMVKNNIEYTPAHQ